VENQIGFNDSYENYKRICCQGDNKIC